MKLLRDIEPILSKCNFILLVLLFSNLGYSQNKTKDSIKVWSSTNKINIIDFEKESITDSIAGEKVSGLSNVALKLYYLDNSYRFNVKTIFNKKKSYIIKVNNTQNLLQHEQLHFDILEIYARKIRKKLLYLYSKDDEIDMELFNLFFNNFMKEYIVFDENYDIETGHSIYNDVQESWNNKIALMLKNTEEYSSENYIKKIDDLLD